MSYIFKKKFGANDLLVGDLMYDAKEDVMVEVVHIAESTVELTYISELGLFDTIKKNEEDIKQFVLKNVEAGTLFIIDVFVKNGELPHLDNGKPRFRHLIRPEDRPIINWPMCPQKPDLPVYPTDPFWYPYQTWCTTDIDTLTDNDTITNIDNPSRTTYSNIYNDIMNL